MKTGIGRALTTAIVGLVALALAPTAAHALSGQGVMDIKIWNGGSQNAQSNPCPVGYELDDTNLNHGAGGSNPAYMYLCVKMGPLKDVLTGGVTNIDVVSSKDDPASNPCPSGWIWLDQAFNRTASGDRTGDLNDGAGGNYIYICFERGSTGPATIGKGPPIVAVDAHVEEHDFSCRIELPGEWEGAGDDGPAGSATDLNAGSTPITGHRWIHLCFKDVEADEEANINWCGNENEVLCSPTSTMFFENGSGPCDRGLRPVEGRCVNGAGNHGRFQGAAGDFQQTWEYWALRNQRRQLQADVPLGRVMLLGAHNAFNNTADGYLLANQRYSITDALRSGITVVDLDLHDATTGYLKLCHGDSHHAGCLATDRQSYHAFKELRNWMVRNPDEVVVVLIQDEIDDPAGRAEQVNEPIELFLDRSDIGVFTPDDYRANGGLQSQRWMVENGKRVVVVSQSDDFEGEYVIAKRDVSFLRSGRNDWGGTPPNCTIGSPGLVVRPEDDLLAEVFESRLFTDNRRLIGPAELAGLTRCNVDIVNLDRLLTGPSDDDPFSHTVPSGRIKEAVWSWAEGDRGDNGDAALLAGATGRWVSRDPAEEHAYACRSPQRDPQTGDYQWLVTLDRGPWREGWQACEAEFPGTEFATPLNAWQNQRLRNQRFGQDIWLNYQDIREEGDWRINRPPKVHFFAVDRADEGTIVPFAYFAEDDDGPPIVHDVDCGPNAVTEEKLLGTPTGNFRCRFLEGPGAGRVAMRLEDSIGVISVVTKVLAIDNVAPTVESLTLDPDAIDEDGTVTLSGAFTDPGVQDAHEITLDWGDGTEEAITTELGDRAFEAPHRYLDDDPSGTSTDEYEIMVTIRDDDGGEGEEATDLLVRNVAPVAAIEALRDDAGLEPEVFLVGLTVHGTFSFEDVGTRDTRTATVHWDDGSDLTDLGAVLDSAEAGHIYAEPGSYTVAVQVIDDDTGSATAVADIEVLTPAAVIGHVTEDLRALSPAGRAGLAAAKAIGHLDGNGGGRAANGALAFLAAGDPAAALAALRVAILQLEEAEAADATLDLAAEKSLLALAAKSIAVEAIAAAHERATTAAHQAKLADASDLIVQGDAALADRRYADAATAYRGALNRALEV